MSHAPHEQFNSLIDSGRNSEEHPRTEFIAALETRLHHTFSKDHMNKGILQKIWMRPAIPFTALALVVLAIGVIATLQNQHGQIAKTQKFDRLVFNADLVQADFDLQPTKSDVMGVASDTAFTLTTKQPFSAEDITASLAFSPPLQFDITASGDTEYFIQPSESLQPGTVYQVSLGSTINTEDGAEKQRISWAYQVKDELRVTGMLPRHRATNVPLDTGIEVTFNTDQYTEAEKFFSISPATKGRFERHGRVLVFVAEERLSPTTVYTVKVSKGLGVADSDVTLTDDVIAQFETTGENQNFNQTLTFADAFTAVQTGEAPVINFQYSNNAPALQATIYKADDRTEFLDVLKPYDELPEWAFNARMQFRADTTNLTKVGEQMLRVEGPAAHFTSGFDAGYYILEIVSGDERATAPLIVSDIAASLVMSNTDSVVWLYDLKTAAPLADATVRSVIGDTSTSTNAEGLATLETPEQVRDPLNKDRRTRTYYSIDAKDGRTTLVPLVSKSQWNLGYGFGRTWSSDYWAHLSTDRSLYRPTDTINVWGIARHRENPAKEKVVLSVMTYAFLDGNDEPVPLVSQTVETGDYSSFRASLPLQELKPGYYTLEARIGSTLISSQSFEIRTFTKPAYQITVTPDKIAGFAGESVTYSVHTEFFDGTPAPNVSLKYAEYGSSGEEGTAITTDAMGNASITKELILSSDYEKNYGVGRSITLFPSQSAEGDIIGSASVFIYPSAVAFWPESTRENDTVTVSTTLHAVDPRQPSSSWWSTAFEGDPVPNATINGVVYEIINTKTKTGEEYDFVEKKVVDRYMYSSHEEERQKFSGTTDKNGVFSKTLTLTGESYRIALTAADDKGRAITRSTYIYDYTALSSGSFYSVVDVNNNTENFGYRSYDIGEETTLQFVKNGTPVTDEGKFLFVRLQNGLQETILSETSALPVTFEDKDAPNVFYTAIWYDGKGFRAPGTYSTARLDFREESRKLDVTVEPLESSYNPGETAKVRVRVTDIDGKGVKAMVNLSAIDEALNVIQWDNMPAPLSNLYRHVNSGLLEQYVSHDVLRVEGFAEGGGGGDGARKDFRDAVLFTDVETDNAGNATVEMKLADNITSWRVTAQAVTKNLYAGHGIGFVSATKPIFGILTMNEEYVSSDQPVLIGAAYGTGVSSGDTVSMTLDIPGLGIHEERTAKAFVAEKFIIPKLAEGIFEAHLTVQSGNSRDELVRSFTVLSSRLMRSVSLFTEAVPGQTLEGSASERSAVYVSDLGRGRSIYTLQSLAYAYGKRLDRHLAAATATDLLKELDPDFKGDATGFEPVQYQRDDGGISLTVYSDSDLGLSALAASRRDLFDNVRLTGYFIKSLERKNASLEEIGAALQGLAFLKQPVIADIDAYLLLDGITDEHRLTAAIAYVALGANDKAMDIAAGLLTKHGETQDPFIRLKLGGNEDAYIINTARFGIVAEALKLKERIGIGRYLAEHFPKDAITNLERSVAQQFAVPLLGENAVSLTYTIGGDPQTIEIKDGKSKALSLVSDELEKFTVVAVSGPVGLTLSSSVPLDLTNTPVDTRLSLNRTFTLQGGERRALREGDVVRVDIAPKIDAGILGHGFLVTDLLPSGLVAITNPWQRDLPNAIDQANPIEVSGQRVSFYRANANSFYYYARVLTPGGYSAESAIIQSEDSRDIINYSGAQTIEIQ